MLHLAIGVATSERCRQVPYNDTCWCSVLAQPATQTRHMKAKGVGIDDLQDGECAAVTQSHQRERSCCPSAHALAGIMYILR